MIKRTIPNNEYRAITDTHTNPPSATNLFATMNDISGMGNVTGSGVANRVAIWTNTNVIGSAATHTITDLGGTNPGYEITSANAVNSLTSKLIDMQANGTVGFSLNAATQAPYLYTKQSQGTYSSPTYTLDGNTMWLREHRGYNSGSGSYVTGFQEVIYAVNDWNVSGITHSLLQYLIRTNGSDGNAIRFGVNSAGFFKLYDTYTLPKTTGSAGQVLTSDGAGTVSWNNASSGSTKLTTLVGVNTTQTISYTQASTDMIEYIYRIVEQPTGIAVTGKILINFNGTGTTLTYNIISTETTGGLTLTDAVPTVSYGGSAYKSDLVYTISALPGRTYDIYTTRVTY